MAPAVASMITSPSIAFKQTHVSKARSSTTHIVCGVNHRQQAAQPLTELSKKTAGALLGAATAISLALSPLPAHAVSGGGGMGTSMSFKDLTGQDLRKSNFTKADLRGADFSGANLEGIRMFGAIAVDCKFVGTNMRGVDLELADLEGADFTNAILEGALLQNAQVQRIKSIEGADFTDVLIRKDVQLGLCKKASGTNPTTGVDTRESLFCP